MRKKAQAVVAILAVTMSATACAAFKQPLDEPLRSQTRTLLLPPPELSAALEKSLNECARKEGWSKKIPFSGPVLGSIAGFSGILPEEKLAVRIGYPSTVREESSSTEGMTAEQRRRVIGPDDPAKKVSVRLERLEVSVDSEGCVAEARKAVYGDLVTSMRIENFFNEAPRTATDAMKRAEKSLKSAAYGYEKCMKAAGYPVKLGEAPKLAAEKWGQYRADGAPVHEEEKAMIRQDVACQKAENIREDVDNAVLDGLGSWARGNEEKIVELSTLTQESLERARKILSE